MAAVTAPPVTPDSVKTLYTKHTSRVIKQLENLERYLTETEADFFLMLRKYRLTLALNNTLKPPWEITAPSRIEANTQFHHIMATRRSKNYKDTMECRRKTMAQLTIEFKKIITTTALAIVFLEKRDDENVRQLTRRLKTLTLMWRDIYHADVKMRLND